MKLKTVVRAIALLGVTAPVLAQTTATSPAPQRVEITGSSIKRIASEGALPVQVITAADLQRTGIQTAEELLRSLGLNAAGADSAESNNNVFGSDTDRLTGGSANANLRGLGPGSTLVLLNGRRISTHGMSAGAVDLNAIPMAAVDRIEVLKDGASAIYGTDAIGGVINFILKKDFNGVDVGASFSQPLASGGGTTRRAQVTVGKGSLDNDGFNLMASLTVDRNDILRGRDRSFANGFQPSLGLSPDSSSHPFANVINLANTALPAAGSVVGATDPAKYTRINLLSIQGQCDAIETGVQYQPQLWNASQAANKYNCNTDYGRQYMLTAPKEATNLVARGSLKLGSNHTAFAEVTASQTKVKSELTPSQFSTTAAAANHYPVTGPYYLNLKDAGVAQFDPTKPIAYRWRMQDFGNRLIENVVDNARFLVGLDGDIGRYAYKLGLSTGSSEGYANLIDGYAYSALLNAALKTGVINPWVKPGEKQTAAAMALIESTKARGRLQGGETGLTQFDGNLSGEVMKLPAGTLDFAVGFDVRRESYEFAPGSGFSCVSTLATTVVTDVLLCPGNSAVPKVSRDVKAVYAELAVPVFKGLDLQLAVRHDEYSGIGGTTNPKVAFAYRPSSVVLLRGSLNTGFRAPSFQQLSLNLGPRDLTTTYNDPIRCAADPTQCAIVGLDYTDSGNPNLKPEKSKQGTLGIVIAPTDALTIYADYWRVDLTDRLRKLLVTDVLANYALFPERFERDATGNITVVRAGWINAAESTTRGIDWGTSYRSKLDSSTLAMAVDGTYMLRHRERALAITQPVDLVGKFGARTIYLRNKLTGSATWASGPWSTTLTGTYKSGYKDEAFPAGVVPPPGANEFVSSYTTFGLFATYTGFKNTSITIGVRNLLDTDPPFTHHNVDNVVGAGWDPRVADPAGRTLTLSAKYSF